MLCAIVAMMAATGAHAEHFTFVAVNDTHSQILPAKDNRGGILRRRAIYDAIRRDNPDAVFIHAGDAVQGTVFFSLYGGEVEYAAIDSLGYDMIILGNHEFDNGLDSLAHFYRNIKAKKLSVNYDFSGTPLEGIFEPYLIKAVGNKRVAFFGINIEPAGLIADKNCTGLRYVDCLKAADGTAEYLKKVLGVDYAIMLSHVGYSSLKPGTPNDTMIIRRSHYIDGVVSSHSHTVLKPNSSRCRIPNADGRLITIGQNGKSGKLVAKYDLDLETGELTYEHIDVDSTWDQAAQAYPAFAAWIDRYAHGVDSLMHNPVGYTAVDLTNRSNTAPNWISDATMDIICHVAGVNDVQFAIMNKGGIRTDINKGVVTEGQLNSMLPFDNRYMVLDITGKDLLEALAVMAGRNGDAVSKELDVAYKKDGTIVSATVAGQPIDPAKTYRMVTIDYLANGGDYMTPLTRAKRVFVDEINYGKHILQYVKDLNAAGRQITTTSESRMHRVD